MPSFHYTNPVLDEQAIADMAAPYAKKWAWFIKNGYNPHYYQTLFHFLTNPETGRLARFRHLVAGRRGGKTLSAAEEVVYYCLNPEEFHHDAHGKVDDRGVYTWVLTRDYPMGKAALDGIREALKKAGAEHGKEYTENKSNRWFEFENGSFIHFKTADNPESLRGAGLDILWIDEAAFVTDKRAWEVVRPALSDKLGIVITTTTPDGKNWFYDEFWSDQAKNNTNQGRVEYRSIDNPHFASEEWLEVKRVTHPMIFKQEFMASFDSMAGKELSGEWLKFYENSEVDRSKLHMYIGVDPAVSLSDSADRFAMALIGKAKDNSQVYLLELFAGRIAFPEQVDKINEWHLKYRPQLIGIEKVAYQEALSQQVSRLDSFPPVIPMFTRGKKSERILAMSPLFRIGKIRVRKDHVDFINEWVDYDSTKKNPKDDCLDAVEICLRTAGVLLASRIEVPEMDFFDFPASSMEELARRDRPKSSKAKTFGVDEHLGADW